MCVRKKKEKWHVNLRIRPITLVRSRGNLPGRFLEKKKKRIFFVERLLAPLFSNFQSRSADKVSTLRIPVKEAFGFSCAPVKS
jgi:hypothetical protein